MRAIKLDKPDRSLGAPPNWNAERDGVCNTLDIWDRDGAMISGWRPTPEELAKLNAGDPLFLHILGASHPVVSMSVGYETRAENPVRLCSVCDAPQFDSPGGVTCPSGHGGAESK